MASDESTKSQSDDTEAYCDEDCELAQECMNLEMEATMYRLEANLSRQRVLVERWRDELGKDSSKDPPELRHQLEAAEKSIAAMERQLNDFNARRADAGLPPLTEAA
jgi:predicted RNase H-like nuclease (RuvC/YqgF family)